jgi:hypothetical protein
MRIRSWIWIVMIVAVLSLARAAASQDPGLAGAQGQAGAPASAGQEAPSAEESQPPAPPSDSRSFLGAEEFLPGRLSQMHSYFLPSFMFSEMADSNYQIAPGQQRWETINSIVGRLTLGKMGKHSDISMDYFGGAQVYNHRSDLNSTIHQFGFTGSYHGRRWSFLVDDRASYLPESTYGFGGFGYSGGLGLCLGGATGSNLANLNPAFDTSGAFLTGRGSRILNTSVVQVQYATSARSSISMAGSFSLLHFRQAGFYNTKSGAFYASYSHKFTPRDFVGVDYGLSLFKLQSSVPAFQSHILQMSYGHQISGRLAMQVGAGPLINEFTNPVSGSSTLISWSAIGSLQYRARIGSLGLSYSHYTTGGGGVLAGASTDRVYASWGMRLSRKWSGSLGPGFSHNRSLPQTTTANTKRTYDSFYGRASLSRTLGRYATMFFSYEYQAQRTDFAPCSTGACGGSLLRHVVGFGFDFHPRQLVFD